MYTLRPPSSTRSAPNCSNQLLSNFLLEVLAIGFRSTQTVLKVQLTSITLPSKVDVSIVPACRIALSVILRRASARSTLTVGA